ncbi:hypothetical protein EE612_031232 [Oryza sativa]|nr:hypothetical protein EE612_031232 [Oryza sativa]
MGSPFWHQTLCCSHQAVSKHGMRILPRRAACQGICPGKGHRFRGRAW